MTAGQPSEVDLDLLADYLGGVLTDTPEEAVVARLISADPEWAAAYAALTLAVDSVQHSLTGWAATTGPMPADITDRLALALADAGPANQPGIPIQSTEQAERRLTAVPRSDDRAHGGRDRTNRAARRRWSRLAGPVAVAAAVVAFAGFGLSRFGIPTTTTAADNAASRGAADGPATVSGLPPQVALPGPEQLLASGTNYATATLPRALTDRWRTDGAERGGTDAANPPGASSSGTPGSPGALGGDTASTMRAAPDQLPRTAGLTRLADQGALAACLEAIALAHGLGPVTFSLVDYAAFEGTPALVTGLVDRTGARWASISGPDCGLPGSGPDTRYRVRVG